MDLKVDEEFKITAEKMETFQNLIEEKLAFLRTDPIYKPYEKELEKVKQILRDENGLSPKEKEMLFVSTYALSPPCFFLDRKTTIKYGIKTSLYLHYLLDKMYEAFKRNEIQKDFSFPSNYKIQIEELKISENQIRDCKKKLKEAGFLSTEVRGLPPKEFFYLNLKKIEKTIDLHPLEKRKIFKIKRTLGTTSKQIGKGFVYFIFSKGFTKIGKTRDLTHRVRSLQNSCPFKVRILHYIPVSDSSKAEEIFHRHYAKYRKKGEWFELPEEEIKRIRQGIYPDGIKELLVKEVRHGQIVH